MGMSSFLSRRLRSCPLVALDWNYVRGLSGNRLPAGRNYLINEVMLSEAAHSENNPEGRVKKLVAVLQDNLDRIVVGKHWNHVVDLEKTPGLIVATEDTINAHFRPGDRVGDAVATHVWLKEATAGDSAEEYKRTKSAFNEQREDHKSAAEKAAEQLGGDLRATSRTVFEKGLTERTAIVDWICKDSKKYDTDSWREALACFPDRHAVGRMFRIWVWQWFRATYLSNEDRLRNDAEDSAYLFSASYADEFWTHDGDLGDACRVLFPTVRVQQGPT
jgi:hypothetical protein